MDIDGVKSLGVADRRALDAIRQRDDERLHGEAVVRAARDAGRYRRNFAFRAVIDGQLIGACTGVCSLGLGYVHELFVEEAHRGAGVGSALLAEAEGFCADHGARRLALRTHRDGGGVQFYEHRGWHVELQNLDWFGGDVYVQMRKDLR